MSHESSAGISIQDMVEKELSSIKQISNIRFSYWSSLSSKVRKDYLRERRGRQIIPAPLDGLKYETLFAIYDSMDSTMQWEARANRTEEYPYLAAKFYFEQAMDAMLANYPERTRKYIAEIKRKECDVSDDSELE